MAALAGHILNNNNNNNNTMITALKQPCGRDTAHIGVWEIDRAWRWMTAVPFAFGFVALSSFSRAPAEGSRLVVLRRERDAHRKF